jgi:hypothetical protein
MENLFSEDPQFRRVQYKKLSDNVREWQEEIGALVSEKLPKDLGLSVTMVFQNVNEEKGYAVGSAIAKNANSDKSIGVPVVVKSWHLAPIDLFFSEGKIYPLTDKNIAKAFFQNSLGAGLATAKKPPNMADDSFAENRTPPLGGKYSYSSPLSMINLLEGTLGAKDLSMMKEAVANQPALLAAFHKRGTFDVLCKFAAENPKQDMQDKINSKRAIALFTIKKDGPDAYRLYSALDEVYDPSMVSTDRQGIKHLLELKRSELWDYEKDPLHSIDQYGEFTIEPPKSPYGAEVDGPSGDASLGQHKNPWVFDPLQDNRSVNTIDTFGRYGVRDADGVLAKGWVIPNVVGFDGNPVSTKLFLGKALSAIQGRICGISLKDDDDDVGLEPEAPDTGKIGTLIYREGDRVMATTPFQVTSVTVYKGIRSLGICDYKGVCANLIISPNMTGIVRVKDAQKSSMGPLLGSGVNYLVSAKMSFVRMPRLCSVSESPDEFNKLTIDHLDSDPVKVASSNGRYILRGGAIPKYAAEPPKGRNGRFEKVAFDFNSLARHEATFLLRSWGLDHEKTAEVLDKANHHIHLEVHHLNFKPLPSEVKTASVHPARRKIISSMRTPVTELMKIAANIEDAQSVDSVLGLGFINEENITRFASAKPMLWEVCHMLGKLLLASRMGMEDIPEEAARSALNHMQRVIEGLDKLQMLEQHKKTSSANVPSAMHFRGQQPGAARVSGLPR